MEQQHQQRSDSLLAGPVLSGLQEGGSPYVPLLQEVQLVLHRTTTEVCLCRHIDMKVYTNWYIDSRATDHITSELDKLSIHDRYHGGDHVHTANGSGMKISHVGHSIMQFYHIRFI